MIMVVGAILLVASFGTFNIVSTITHEKARDIAIMKSLGLRESTVRRIFVLEATIIGVVGALIGLSSATCSASRWADRVQDRLHGRDAPAGALLAGALRAGGLGRARLLRDRGLVPRAKGRAGAPRRHHPGRVVSGTPAIVEAVKATRVLGGEIPTTLVKDIDLAVHGGEFVAVTGPSGSASRR